jgi:hypothetical protein
MVYRGAHILVYPGMNVPSTTSPSGGVTRELKVRIAGSSRIDSLIVALRCSNAESARASETSTPFSSVRMIFACSGYCVKKYNNIIRLGAVVSLANVRFCG